MNELAPHQAGAIAFRSGTHSSYNPYPFRTQDWLEWISGFDEAREDAQDECFVQQWAQNIINQLDGIGCDWGMRLIKLIDGVSTYEARVGECVREFDNTDDLYEWVAETKNENKLRLLIDALVQSAASGGDTLTPASAKS